jgi:hypothetical protein
MSTGNGGRAAAGIVEALKGSPLVLALILTNAALLAFLFYSESRATEQRKQLGQLIFDHCIKKN